MLDAFLPGFREENPLGLEAPEQKLANIWVGNRTRIAAHPTLYARYLRSFSEGYGIKRVQGRIGEVAMADNGDIAALVMQDGSRIEGDLFIDCTGFRALLIGDALGVGFEGWSHWLLTDRAVAVQTESVRDAVPYVRVIAGDAGWQRRIPLQHRQGNGIVFSSRYLDEQAARDALISTIEGQPRTEPRLIRFRHGQRKKAWERNCVALGWSSGFLEPLESTSIHLIQRGTTRLLQSFPHVVNDVDIDECNQQIESEIIHVRDFVILHYHVTNQRDTQFWRACAEMKVPQTLRHRIELFAETGRVLRVPNELFAENSWIQVMLGQGITPRQRHPSPDLMGGAELTYFMGGIRQRVKKTVARLPTRMDYIRSYCAPQLLRDERAGCLKKLALTTVSSTTSPAVAITTSAPAERCSAGDLFRRIFA